MYDELLTALRKYSCQKYSDGCGMCPSFKDGCAIRAIQQAADAIEKLSKDLERSKEWEEFWEKEANEALKKFQTTVDRMPRWIPVTERLPKADEYDVRGYAVPYLVMNGWMRVTARRTKDYWVLFGEGKVLEYVTNWMPLPEPPKEEKK